MGGKIGFISISFVFPCYFVFIFLDSKNICMQFENEKNLCIIYIFRAILCYIDFRLKSGCNKIRPSGCDKKWPSVCAECA